MAKRLMIDEAAQEAARKSIRAQFPNLQKMAGNKHARAGFAFALLREDLKDLGLMDSPFHAYRFWAIFEMLDGKRRSAQISGFAFRALKAIQGAAGAYPESAKGSRGLYAGLILGNEAHSAKGDEELIGLINAAAIAGGMESNLSESRSRLKDGRKALQGFALGLAARAEHGLSPIGDEEEPSDEALLMIESEAPASPAPALLIPGEAPEDDEPKGIIIP
jgi:hypothetical protein